MASKLAQVKDIVLDLLSDGKEHTSGEMQKVIREKGLELEQKSSVLRTAIFQLRNSGIDIYSRDRGIYQIRRKKDEDVCPFLKDFITLLPEQKISPKCIYVHGDGHLTLNGRLNAEIKTRQIEIKISNDAKRIALIPDGENYHKFTKIGRTQNVELAKKLKSKHFTMPVTYVMERDEDSGVWIGEMSRNIKSINNIK